MEEEEKEGEENQDCCDREDDLGLDSVFSEVYSIGPDIIPGQEADSSHHYKGHYYKIYSHIGGVGGEG